MGEVLADAPALQEFLNFMSQSRNSLPNQLLLSGQNADITDARTFQQWKDAGRHIRTGEEGYTAIVGQVYENCLLYTSTWRGVAVWDKVASRPQKGRFRQQSEYIVWGSNGKMPLERNVGCLPGVFRYPNPQRCV